MNNTYNLQLPLVSIIIVNYNGCHYLGKCFDSLCEGIYKNIEIIFVDNGSTDGSLEFVKKKYQNIKIVDNKKNLGLSIASNNGAKLAHGKYLFFYNNDTIADRNLINKLVEKAESDANIGICGCKTLSYDGKSVLNIGASCDIFGYPYSGGKIFYVDAAIFIRRDIFDEIGGFDPEMFLYGEDRDICWRCWIYGYKVVVVPDAFFYHDSACATLELSKYRTNTFKRFHGEFNAIRSILKNYSILMVFIIFPTYLLINFTEIVLYSVIGRFNIVFAVYLKAYWKNFQLLKNAWIFRRRIQSERKGSDFTVMKNMSLISRKFLLFLKIGLPKFTPVKQIKTAT